MNNFLMILKLISAIYPILVQTIKALEEAIPDPGQGSVKLDVLKATLAAAYTKMEDTKMKFDEVWPSIQMVVSAIVAGMNASGKFKKQ